MNFKYQIWCPRKHYFNAKSFSTNKEFSLRWLEYCNINGNYCSVIVLVLIWKHSHNEKFCKFIFIVRLRAWYSSFHIHIYTMWYWCLYALTILVLLQNWMLSRSILNVRFICFGFRNNFYLPDAHLQVLIIAIFFACWMCFYLRSCMK